VIRYQTATKPFSALGNAWRRALAVKRYSAASAAVRRHQDSKSPEFLATPKLTSFSGAFDRQTAFGPPTTSCSTLALF